MSTLLDEILKTERVFDSDRASKESKINSIKNLVDILYSIEVNPNEIENARRHYDCLDFILANDTKFNWNEYKKYYNNNTMYSKEKSASGIWIFRTINRTPASPKVKETPLKTAVKEMRKESKEIDKKAEIRKSEMAEMTINREKLEVPLLDIEYKEYTFIDMEGEGDKS